MTVQDALKTKEKIISTIRNRGPCLPVHIAKETGLSILFAGAFLSELLAEKTIRISHMKVGGTPIYYIPGQEAQLEKFSEHLKSKEKDAYILLKEKKFLLDREQEPALRVALRAIKDFAVPFERYDSLYWKYYTTTEEDFKEEFRPIVQKTQQPIQISPPEKEVISVSQIKSERSEPIVKEGSLDIFEKVEKTEKPEKKEKIEKPKKVKPSKPKKPKAVSSKKNEAFFERVKEFLAKKGMEISDIKSFSKNELTLIVKNKSKELLLVAYNKKNLKDSDIIKAHKKSQELELPYLIFSLGEPAKKTSSLIEALKNLSGWEKVE